MSRALIGSVIDLRAALNFLELLEPTAETHCFCWFVQRHTDGRVRQFYGTLEDTLDTLIDFNKDGYSVFVCVNAIDEPVYLEDKPKRRKQDVTRVRAVFGDFDDPSLPLPTFALEPSIIVETSPGKHHAYWLVESMPLADFEQRQAGIIERYAANGSDKSIRDLSRVMRVPGFAHVKDPDKPKTVRVLSASGVRYSAEVLAAAFPSSQSGPPEWDHGGIRDWDGVVSEEAHLTHLVVKANWKSADGVKYHVPCPWEHLHSGKSNNPNATTYFAPNAYNNGRGGFKCQHAHCSLRHVEHFDLWIQQQVRSAK